MNKKGFTLIELLAVIVVLGVVLLLAMPSILDSINASRDSSYKILIGNIKTAAETYYQECEYGDLSDKNKYGNYAKYRTVKRRLKKRMYLYSIGKLTLNSVVASRICYKSLCNNKLKL